ncbi:MAG: VOC family protein, partial [Calditrichia bacterium]
MKPNFKPQDYNSVSVYIMAADAQMVIDFMHATFNATETRRYETPDGGIMHAEVKIDDTIVMIADAGEDYPAFPVWMHVYV